MIWFLMIIAGGTTSQSGIAIDTRQTFPTEAECISTRDQIRATSAAGAADPKLRKNSGSYQIEFYQQVTANCFSRPRRIVQTGE